MIQEIQKYRQMLKENVHRMSAYRLTSRPCNTDTQSKETLEGLRPNRSTNIVFLDIIHRSVFI
jgi:hypothetical protein